MTTTCGQGLMRRELARNRCRVRWRVEPHREADFAQRARCIEQCLDYALTLLPINGIDVMGASAESSALERRALSRQRSRSGCHDTS